MPRTNPYTYANRAAHGGLWLQWSPVNVAYFLRWQDTSGVLRVLPADIAADEVRYLLEGATEADLALTLE